MAIYGLMIILLVFTVYVYLKFRWQMKTQLQLEHAETERLKKLDEFKTKLYTNISHEFRTPLTLISGPIDKQLERDDLTTKDEKDLNLVKQNANRLMNLVNQMLDLSLIDSGQLTLKISKGNLSVLINQILAAFEYKSKEKGIHFQNNIDKIETAYFDSDIIEKVLSNLLSNAIKYAPTNSVIKVNLSKQNHMAVLSVVNGYEDLKRRDLTKLFQRFYQDNEASDGVGVGLALVKELVNHSKGTVVANTIEDDKIQFSVTLPISRNAFVDYEMVKTSNTTETNLNLDSATDVIDAPTLLIVEDDKDINEFVSSIFKDGYKILFALDGSEGIKMAKKHLPDLIISDIMMPKTDGIELCNKIKQNELTSHIPIILLTAKVGQENEIIGLNSGADAYITKPFNSKRLMVEVKRLIDNRQKLKELYSKEFTINPELAITSTETDFLNRLKEVLDEHITDPNFKSERFSSLLSVSRTQLHRKLKSIYGISTSEFIRSQRLKLAQRLLEDSDGTIAEIAYQVGFNSSSYFIKSFKEVYNMTPNEYQNNL